MSGGKKTMHTIADKKLLMLKPDNIVTGVHCPRKVFDEYEIKSLADSISVNGIIQPLTVRKGSDGKYILISGERRLRAAKIVGMRRVPCVLHRADEMMSALYSLTENIQHRDLTFFEEADAISTLISDYGLTQSEIASQLGLSNSAVSNKLRLLKLSPEIQERLSASQLNERYARLLLQLPAEQRETALDKIIAEDLNFCQAEKFVNSLLNPPQEKEICNKKSDDTEETLKPVRKSAIGDVKLFSNSLSKLICTMQNAGISANSKKHENDKYIEYKIRISKNQPQCEQLKIC